MEETDTTAIEGEHQEQAQPTIEEVARSIGYRSKEELKDPSKHVDAATYIKNTAKFKDGYQQEIRNLKRSLDGVTDLIRQTAAAKYDEGVKAAEERLKAAKEAFDPDEVERATLEVSKAKQVAASGVPQKEPEEVTAFCEKNPWFEKNPTMRTDALDYREKFLKANPNAPITEVLEYIETKIKKDYPEKFETKQPEKKHTAAGPEGTQTNNTGSQAAWERQEKELNDVERNTMNAMCQQMHNGKPIMTKKQYIESMAANGRFGR